MSEGFYWRRRPGSWWPACLPWIGVETLELEDQMELGLPVTERWRVVSVEWFHHGITIAAWRA